MSKSNCLVLLSCLVFVFLFSACQTPGGSVTLNWPSTNGPGPEVEKSNGNGPPPHAKAHGYHRKYGYKYYPEAKVYYAPERMVYFYMDENGWQMSAKLPYHLKIKLGDSVTIEMGEEKPYVKYDDHRVKYPPGQLKKKKKKKKHKWK